MRARAVREGSAGTGIDRGERLPVSGARLVDVDAEWRVSTDELRLRLDDPGLTIVDVRPLAAYNGWSLLGAARGGHIPGAVAFPSAWLDRVDDAEVQRLLRVEGHHRRERDRPLRRSPRRRLGHENAARRAGPGRVRVYDAGWAEWAADETLPVERLPHYDRLVHTAWLRQLLDGGRPEAAPAGASCSSTSTSACPRSTRRAISPVRSTSTPTSSRTRSTGTGARRRSSRRPCARSGSPTTPP